LPRVVGQPDLAPERRRATHATLHLVPMESSILANFRRGDAGAIRAMYLTYGHLVYVVAHRVLGRDDLAEEATRQTFAYAWQAAAGLDIHRDPSPWLARIAKRSAVDIHRREARIGSRARDDAALDALAAVEPLPPTDTLDAAWKVRRLIDALPPAERTVLQLQHRDGMTHGEIATQLGVSLDTVKSRSDRAHDQVARLLGHLRESMT
jgi:RNA polymerase sigma factor (sigma-70 family)